MKKISKKLWRRNRVLLLVALIVGEALVGTYLWSSGKSKAMLGFLAKRGSEYVVIWKAPDAQMHSESYGSLAGALDFAKDELHLAAGRVMRDGMEPEHVWVDDRFGGYVLLWKTESSQYLNQMTFQSHNDARFFADAFNRGSYTPSPFGHSVLLLPRAN